MANRIVTENLLYRHVPPACDELGIRRANFLTFRRTFSTWSHYSGIPAKDIAALMGLAGVQTQFIYVPWMKGGVLRRRGSAHNWSRLVTALTKNLGT